MKLKKLLIKKTLEEKRNELNKLDFESLKEKREALNKRTSDAEEALNELTEESTEEERQAVSDEIDDITKVDAELKADEEALGAKKEELEAAISDLENELQQDDSPEGKLEKHAETNKENRSVVSMKDYQIRTGFFKGWEKQDAESIVSRDEVKTFIGEIREIGLNKRAVLGADITVPDTIIGLIRDNIHNYSKLVKHVWLRKVNGTARVNIAGQIPEGVWTEACAVLNELDLRFYQHEVDGYKVGGYVPVCNALLEDSDLSLSNEILDILAQSIAYALDKAILYGTGKKMPLGIVTRLAQPTKPEDWSAKLPEWENLSTSNILQVTGETGVKFVGNLLKATGNAKATYGEGNKFWAMNETTWATIRANIVAFDASGVAVSANDMALPVVGGAVEILPFMAEGDIVGGYGARYLLAERSGMKLAKSEHVQFIEDNTVFKGTARYDGMPTNGAGFVALNISGKEPTKTMEFALDKANQDAGTGV